MKELLASIEGEFRRYKKLGEGAIEQVEERDLVRDTGSNSIAVIVWHISGNLKSRFTDFLTSDGEKPWRDRESEFADRSVSRADLLAKWEDGWSVLLSSLALLNDADLSRDVQIRGVSLKVHEALHRSLAHLSYHVGQIVLLAKGFSGKAWKSLSIPKGGSAAYNTDPTNEKSPR